MNRQPSKSTLRTSLETQEGSIEYSLKRSRARRTLTICVDEKAQVSVAAPHYARQEEILSFLQKKSKWILEKVTQARQINLFLAQKQFDHGHYFFYLGQKYPIEVAGKGVARPELTFNGQSWKVSVPRHLSFEDRRLQIKKQLIEWYRAQAAEILGSRIFHFSRILGVAPKKIIIRMQKRKWGSCNYRTQTIRLNWQIILSAPAVIDYVVVHELCHLLIPNHSKRFWKKVAGVLPDYAQHKKWLKVNALDMTLP